MLRLCTSYASSHAGSHDVAEIKMAGLDSEIQHSSLIQVSYKFQ
jgi:hypothetical protein